MKAIILAAGMGKRLGELTKDNPKCLLNFLGKSLIERQLENFVSCGIKDIIVVAGYKEDKIDLPGVKKVINGDYETTNMVESLFRSEGLWDDAIIISYGDIIYEKRILEDLIGSDADIGVVVDKNGVNYFKNRFGNDYLKHLESLKFSTSGAISNIGEAIQSDAGVEGQYIGLLKFSKNGIKGISSIYHRDRMFYNSPWMRSRSLRQAYMTDMIQKMIDEGLAVRAVPIDRGWLEFDSVSDYNKYMKWHEEGVLKDYYCL
jgi:phosphoenolpyruvate phosphomutase